MATSTVVREAYPITSTAPIAAGERVAVIDVLCGFALLGILIVNMTAFKGSDFGSLQEASVTDRAAPYVVAFGFQTKFYVLFSFLFGYGLSVQMSRAQA